MSDVEIGAPSLSYRDRLLERLRSWRIAGDLAHLFVVLIATLWIYWGFSEMYYEGWWGEWGYRLVYLIPGIAFVALSLIAIPWPRFGGWALVLIGGGFTFFFWSVNIPRWGFNLRLLLNSLPVTGLFVVLGALILLGARARRREKAARLSSAVTEEARAYLQENWRYVLAIGLPLLIALSVSIASLSAILTRTNDHDFTARLIQGNGVQLIWAPAGPGWGRGMHQVDQNDVVQPGRVLSWNRLALYGAPPLGVGDKDGLDPGACTNSTQSGCATSTDMLHSGLCSYLSVDGYFLLDQPQGYWRLPTVDEIVRSLVRHGQNAGCEWDGASQQPHCRTSPDKETPLWDPNSSAIYYWAVDEHSTLEAYYVNFAGSVVEVQPKSFGNPRHGYRCVQEP